MAKARKSIINVSDTPYYHCMGRYLELVDWTGRAIRDDKKGHIDDLQPKIIDKLGFSADIWLQSVEQFSEHSYSHIGTEDQLKAICDSSGLNWLAGIKQSREFVSIY